MKSLQNLKDLCWILHLHRFHSFIPLTKHVVSDAKGEAAASIPMAGGQITMLKLKAVLARREL
jgi:hypothetical protein